MTGELEGKQVLACLTAFQEDMCRTGLGNGEYKHNPSGIFKHGILREKQAALKELDPFPILLKSVRESQGAP